MNIPCYDCCQRYNGCHDGCPSYKQYKLHKEMASQRMDEDREFESYLQSAKERMIKSRR